MSLPSFVASTVRRRRHSLLLGSADYTGSTLTSSVFALTANGSATTTLTATVTRNEALASGETVEYAVSRTFVSAALSTLDTDASTIDATTGTANITAYVKDTNGVALPGIPAASLSLASTGTNNTITAVDSVSDRNGRFRWTFSSSTSEAKTLTLTACGLAVIETVAITVGSASGAAALFSSAWSTATGLTEAALRDTGAVVPWTSYDNDGLTEIVASTGLDFPTTNVLQVTTSWNGSGSSGSIVRLASTLAVPGVGDSLFYRWYWRAAVPSAVTTWGTPHPIQDGFSTSLSNWEFGLRSGGGGTYTPRFNSGGMAWPNDSWISTTTLNTDETYRFELQVHRIGTTTFNMHVRVYDSSDVLILDDSDFRNSNTTAYLSDDPTLTFRDVNELAGLNAGSNGAFQGTTSGDHPFIYCYQGGFRVSDANWCGAYESGETVP